MGVKTIRIYQLDSIVNARLELVGGFFEVEVPAGPVAGGYVNKRLRFEQLAELLGGNVTPNHSKSLRKAFRYLTRAEVTANGGFGEAFEDLDYATCCVQTQAQIEFYQPDPATPRVTNQVLVAIFDGSATPAGYVYVDGSFKPGELVPARFVTIESNEAKYGYVRRDTSPASIADWHVGELSIWSINGADQFATAKQAGGPFPAFTGVEDAYWKPAAAPAQPANLLTSDNAFTGTNTFAKQLTVLDLLVSSVQNVALNTFSKLAAFVQGLVPRLGSTTSADPAATTSSVSNVLSRVFGLSDRVDLLARFLIRWDQERRVTLASGGGNPAYVSGNAFVVVATSASSNGNLFTLAAQDYPRQGDLVAVRVRADSIPLVIKGLRFGSPTGPLTFDGVPGQQYIFHACTDVAGDITATYWQVHSAPSSGTGSDGRLRGPWAASTAYKQYDMVVQANVLYYANAAFTSGTAFDPTNWTSLQKIGRGLRQSTAGVLQSTGIDYVSERFFDFADGTIAYLTRGTATSLKNFTDIELRNDLSASYEGSITSIRNVSATQATAFTYRNVDTNVSTPFFTLGPGEYISLRSTAAAPFTYEIVGRGLITAPTPGGSSTPPVAGPGIDITLNAAGQPVISTKAALRATNAEFYGTYGNPLNGEGGFQCPNGNDWFWVPLTPELDAGSQWNSTDSCCDIEIAGLYLVEVFMQPGNASNGAIGYDTYAGFSVDARTNQGTGGWLTVYGSTRTPINVTKSKHLNAGQKIGLVTRQLDYQHKCIYNFKLTLLRAD